jgi:hypothetical protein
VTAPDATPAAEAYGSQAAAEHLELEPETELGHEYDGPELHPGTPEYEAEYAEYQAWAAEPEPEAEL